MSYRIELKLEAHSDLANSVLWYEDHRYGLGDEFLLAVTDAFDIIQRNPLLFQERFSGVRVALLKHFPFLIYYLLRKGKKTIVILGVLHSRRNPNIIIKERR